MHVQDVVGLCAALIGSTATLVTAWSYLRTHRPPKGELLRVLVVITVVMASILGIAVFISRQTTITVNGQSILPLHGLPAPLKVTPIPSLLPSVTPSPLPSPSPSPSVTPSPSPSPSPSVTPSPSPSPSPSVTPSPSPQPSVTPSP
jgi:hypothetical protein